MPELPDITLYLEALAPRVVGQRLEKIRIASPFLLRSVAPRPTAFEGRKAEDLRRLGKRIAIGFEGAHWLVLHLMIAGRRHSRQSAASARRALMSTVSKAQRRPAGPESLESWPNVA